MPKKSSERKPFKWQGYVNINIAEKEETSFKNYLADSSTVYDDMTHVLVDGYSIKIHADDKDETIRASLTCFDDKDPNFGYVVGAFAGDWYTAVAVLMYKHFHVARENWMDYKQDEKRAYG